MAKTDVVLLQVANGLHTSALRFSFWIEIKNNTQVKIYSSTDFNILTNTKPGES